MRSKQTIFRHAGYQMRSHSETRWASIMDVFAITWLYEPKVVDTRHGWYLPDFYLPAAGMFLEVKGPTPNLVEREKAADVEESTGCPVVFAHGNPEMLGGELFHGTLSYFKGANEATFTTAEIGVLVRKYYSLHTYAAYLAAGERRDRPDVVHISEGLEELFASWMTRKELEKFHSELHAPLNQQKTERHAQSNRAEWVLAEFCVRVAQRQAEKEAA